MSTEKIVPDVCHPAQRRDNFICQYCGRDGLESLDAWHDSTVDHFVPRSHGGTDELSNMVTCCGYCNAIKGNRKYATIDEAREAIIRRRGELSGDLDRVRRSVRGAGI